MADELYVSKKKSKSKLFYHKTRFPAYNWQELMTLAKQDIRKAIRNPDSLAAYLYSE